MDKINKNSFTPPFYQLAAIIEKKIMEGEFKTGEPLPSENDLGREYELSRTTVRKCLSLLAERGMISAQQGRGTFVSRPSLDRAVFVMEDFKTQMERQEKEVGYKLISVRFHKQLPEFALKLGMTPDEGILYYCRLLTANAEPVGIEHKYMCYKKGRPTLENEFQYKAFSEIIAIHTNFLPVRSQAVLTAERASEYDANFLHISTGDPVLRLQQVLYTRDEKTVGIGGFYYRSDRYSLISDVHPLKGER